ncbi:MAG: ATP12 family protein [Alphaproteobacteria bacterium]
MPALKRFYQDATVAEEEHAPGEFRLLLDGRPVKTPRGETLRLPGARLAAVVAGEWQTQESEIRLSAMPMTRLAMSLADHVVPRMSDVRAEALAYASTDLLCYRAHSPAALARRQDEAWQPLLDWAREYLGAPLVVTTGVLPVEQPREAVEALERALSALGAGELFAAHALTHRLGSLVLALAIVRGRIDAEGAFALSRLDEAFQAEQWGEDDEAAERTRRISAETAAIARFLLFLPNRVP